MLCIAMLLGETMEKEKEKEQEPMGKRPIEIN